MTRNRKPIKHRATPRMIDVDANTIREVTAEKHKEESRRKNPPPSKETPEPRRSFGEWFQSILTEIHGKILSINIEKDVLIRTGIVVVLLVVFSVLQTTFGAQFQLFGATPDLMLGLVVALGMSEGPYFGAVSGLAAGLIIDALGNCSPCFSPLLYMPIGYFSAVLTGLYFYPSLPVRALFSLGAGIIRALFTLLQLELYRSVPLSSALTDTVIPEYFATALLAVLPHFLSWISLRAFHKSRNDKVKTH